MPGGSDFLEDYRNPLVQKQFTDQIRELMDSKKISRSEAEAKVLSKRRRDFKKKPMEITKSDSLVPVMPAPVINELSKKQGLFAGMTDKDWESKGGCSYTHVLDIKEAERIEKKSEGFLMT
ncbi:MAG: hypothetical protein K6E91_01200 [Butyrivibrio sp.]|nr:hypothetical protein [Butyrivibrio sp.]